MTRRINIAIYAILLIFVVTVAYAPKIDEKEEPKAENRLNSIEAKLDKLIAASGKEDPDEKIGDKLDEISKKLDKIESLIRTRL